MWNALLDIKRIRRKGGHDYAVSTVRTRIDKNWLYIEVMPDNVNVFLRFFLFQRKASDTAYHHTEKLGVQSKNLKHKGPLATWAKDNERTHTPRMCNHPQTTSCMKLENEQYSVRRANVMLMVTIDWRVDKTNAKGAQSKAKRIQSAV